ncbi:MAG: SdrD B-like domain-containing protein, partial [Ferruginibacter sp.]
VASTVTDAYGNYLFSKLPTSVAGTNYQVRFSLVPGYRFSPSAGAVSLATNSDANVNTGRTNTITLTNAVPNVTYVDAGMYYTTTARLGDFVWNDLNKDGIQDPDEPGIAGVTVMLYTSTGNLYRATITSNDGYYFFDDVPAGTYYVKVTPPLGYQVSPKNIGGTAIDSDIDPTTFKTANITVTAGTSNLTIDAGLNVTSNLLAALGDRVWEDLNNNNIQDPGEPGIANVTVELFNSSNVSQGIVTTDAFGNYIFNGLTPGAYYVKFTLPAGFTFVTQDAGTDDEVDSDVNATGISQTVTLVADEINTTVDAGMRRSSPKATLGDFVWYDLNKDGVQDGGSEVGVPGITVLLYNSLNVVVATTTTNSAGFYLFTGLDAGNYTVGFSNLPAGYGFSPKAGAVTVANNSDVNPFTGRTDNITVAAASNNTFVDAGLVSKPKIFDSKATVGDKLWNDLNNNGIQDAGEPGIAGVIVTLYAGNGTTVVASTTTDALGNYLFTNLDAGTYVVGFGTLPAGYVFATQNAGTDDEKDSDVDTGTGKTAPFTLATGEINLSIDAGARNTTVRSSIGNFVWYDVNTNGIQDAGERGAAGVSVALLNASNSVIATTTTDVNGLYLFTDLVAGTYFVKFGNLPAGFAATTKNAAGSTAANNSDADVTTLTTDAIVLPAATNDLNWDMGIKSTTRASVGDFVWSDLDLDGIQDAGEPGVAGVTVTLFDNNDDPVATTITDANGAYLFSNVLPGTYSVGFSNIPASASFTLQNVGAAALNSDPDPVTGQTASFTLAAGQFKNDVDAGLVTLKAAVGDFVWFDVNRNGIQDANEAGVAGVTVTLYNSSNVAVASAVTDAKGAYLINNVSVAVGGSPFTMRFTDVPSSFYKFTIPLVGGVGASNNSKVLTQDINDGTTGSFTLSPGQIYRDVDAGIYKQINLSGNVWHDANGMTDNLVNQTSTVPIPNNLRVYLVNFSNGGVIEGIKGVPFNTGQYNFTDVNINTNYRIYLTTQAFFVGGSVPQFSFNTLPSDWNNTGEHVGITPGSDGIVNGWLNVPVGVISVTNANFGIKTGGGNSQQ